MGLFRGIWDGIKWLFGLMVPFVAKAGDLQVMGAAYRWGLHFVLLALLLALLTYFNFAFDLAKYLEVRWLLLRRLWLPLLVVLLYLSAWVGWWLWRLLGPDSDPVAFPDIARAWREGHHALENAGLNPREIPVFLVVGRAPAAEEALFQAAHLPLRVRHVPQRPDAPIHLYADEEAIYVTCSGASLLGRQLHLEAEQKQAETASSAVLPSPTAPSGEEGDDDDDLNPETLSSRDDLQLPAASAERHTGAEAERRSQTASVAVEEALAPTETHLRRRPSVLNDAEETARFTARLEYLCRLIVRSRRPSCPLNGLLLIVPFHATASEPAATLYGQLLRQDLHAVRSAAGVDCSLFVLVAGMEEARGFREFLDRFPRPLRQRRVGQQFPFVADLDAAEFPQVVEQGIAWILRELFPPLIYRLLRIEKSKTAAPDDVLRGNVHLVQLLSQLQDRQRFLGRILTVGLAPKHGGAFRLAGCYLASTGKNAAHEQGFVGGVFRRLIESQDFVSWTDEARASDERFRRWTRLGYAGIGLVVGSVFLLGYFLLMR